VRVVVIGGTWFIGRAIVSRLRSDGHEVLLVHRGKSEPDELTGPGIQHLHVDRADLAGRRADVAAFGPDAAVDVSARNGADARAALAALPDGIRLVAISSGDVYRAYEALHSGRQSDGLPLTESSPVRETRHVDGPEFENLEIEELYLPRGATSLRLGAVYGPHDYQRRFEFVLRRLRGGRRRIPIGSGGFLFSKVYVEDVAAAVGLVLAAAPDVVAGAAFNVVEAVTAPFRLFAEQILAAAGGAGAGVELVGVPDHHLPADLELTGALSQHLLMDASRIRTTLGWTETDPAQALRASVAWHLAHPPDDWSRDFTSDDEALAHAVSAGRTESAERGGTT
jgi:nucleoside-diphosphate-sugar epimerase